MRRINLNDNKSEIVNRYLTEYLSTVELGKLYGVHASTIERRLNEWGIPVRSLGANPINHNCFDDFCPEAMYWIGYIAGDGNVYSSKNSPSSYRISITSKDREHLVKFGSFIEAENAKIIKKVSTGKVKGTAYMIRFTSPHVGQTLIDLGITPNKSKSISISSEFVLSSPHFIRGVVDSDGCLFRNGRGKLCVSIATASEGFASQLHRSILGLGVYNTIGFAKASKIYNVLVTRKQEALNFCEVLHYNTSAVSLERKKKIALEFIGDK